MKKLFILFLFLLFITPVFAIDNSSVIKSDNKTTNAASINWVPYMRAIEAKIKSNWHSPKGDVSKRVVVLFKINKNGNLESVKVTQSSGVVENDKAAIQAVQMSAPFQPLPVEYNGTSIDIDFTFDYNVLGSSLSQYNENRTHPTHTQNTTVNTAPTTHYGIEQHYIFSAKQKIIQNWHPKTYYSYYKTREANNLSADVTINRNGELIDYRIVHSSQSKDAEKRAIEAIEKASPFDAFPEDIQKESIKFTIRFIY